MLQSLREALETLPEAQRTVMTLRDVDGWESGEVCELLGISEGNQRVLLPRARSRVRGYVEERLSLDAIVARGHDRETVRRVLRMVVASEYKRRQAAPVLKVSEKAFGEGRRLPIAHGYRT